MRLDFVFSPVRTLPPQIDARMSRATFQRLGWQLHQEKQLTETVGGVLENFARLTKGLKFTAVYHETNLGGRAYPVAIEPANHRLYLTIDKPPADTLKDLPIALCHTLAGSLINDSWHEQTVKTQGKFQTAQDLFDSSGLLASNRTLIALFRNTFVGRLNNLIGQRLTLDLLQGCRYPAEQFVIEFDNLFARIIREADQIKARYTSSRQPDLNQKLVREVTWSLLAEAAYLTTIARKAGAHQLAERFGTVQIAELIQRLSNLQLAADKSSAEKREENFAVFQGFCRAFDFSCDAVQVVSTYN